jgi:hypothetical protein
MTVAEALAAALAVEDQVIYGYGVAGAHLGGSDRDAALQRLQQHELLRDELAGRLASTGAPTVVPSPAYAVPFPVDSRRSAARLAALLEDGTAGAAWDLVAVSAADSPERRLGVGVLGDAATWSARWHALAGAPAPALPGQPPAGS